MSMANPYESPEVRAVTGTAIRPGGLNLTRRAVDYCCLGAGERVLDVGCGTGVTVDFLKRHADARAIGIDLSVGLLDEARLTFPDLPIVRGNAMDLPVRDASLKAVFCECVLSLLAAPEAVLGDFYRVLQPDGYLVVSDLYWRKSDADRIGATESAGGCLGGAVTQQTMERRLSSAGFALYVWEDHSELLKVMAARLAWSRVSLRQWWGWDCRPGDGWRGYPGYVLMIARKRNRSHG